MTKKCPECGAELHVVCVRGCRAHTCHECGAEVPENHSETAKIANARKTWKEWRR